MPSNAAPCGHAEPRTCRWSENRSSERIRIRTIIALGIRLFACQGFFIITYVEAEWLRSQEGRNNHHCGHTK